MKRVQLDSFVSALCALLLAFVCNGQSANDHAVGEVLIRFKSSVNAQEIGAFERAQALYFLNEIQTIKVRLYRLPQGADARAAAARFSQEPIVEFAEPNYARDLSAVNDSAYPNQWSLHNTGQRVNGVIGPAGVDIRWPEAMTLFKGVTPITVAVIDSGVALDHPEILSNAFVNSVELNGRSGVDDDRNGYVDDFTGFDFYALDPLPIDEFGHGTLVASIIAGVSNNNLGGVGISQTARIMSLRVLNQFGRGSVPKFARVSDVALALDYAQKNGARIVNLSLGGSASSTTELLMLRSLSSAGVLVVAAAGNGGDDGIGDNNDVNPIYPASYGVDNIIAVAAQDRSGGIASFSNYGVQRVHIAAPGTQILGADVTRRTVFFQNFNGATPGWTTGSSSGNLSPNSWNIYASTDSFLVDRLAGSTYSPFTNTWVRSPFISLVGVIGARLTFDSFFDLADDVLFIEASVDGIDWFPYSYLVGTSDSIVGTYSVDISDFDGGAGYFRFRLSSNAFFQGLGVAINNFTISSVTLFDPGAPRFQYRDGTSFAAPMVSGVAALVMSQRPDLTASQVRSIILSSARPVSALSGKVSSGGMLDAERALQLVNAATTAPSIAAQPTGQSVTAGGSVTFSVGANGTAPFSYQWRKDGAAISGATGPTLSLSNVQPVASGSYTVVVTNSTGIVISNAAVLTVISTGLSIYASEATFPARLFRVSPANGATSQISPLSFFPGLDFRSNGVLYGSSSTLSTVSTATGTATTIGTLPELIVSIAFSPADELYGVSNDGRTLYKIDPRTGRSLSSVSLTGTTFSTGGVFSGEISGIDFAPDGKLYGIGFGLYLINPNTGVATRVTPSGRYVSGDMYGDLDFGSDGQLRAATSVAGGNTSNLYTIDTAAGIGQLVGPMGARISGLATLPGTSTSSAPVISTQPANISVNFGQPASFTATVTGTPPLTYQWRKDGLDIAGATSATLTIVAPTAAGNYTVVVTNAAGAVTSATAVLTVNVPPSITTAPGNLTVTAGQNASFAVGATGTPAPGYQWRKDGVNIVGATGTTLTLASVVPTAAGNYTVVVTNPAGSVASGAAVLTVNVPPVVTTAPRNLAVSAGQNASFTVVAIGTPAPSYQWRKDGVAIAGATGATLTLANATPTAAGNYTVVVTNAAGSVASAAAVLTVNVPPSITTSPGNLAVTTGQNASFTVVATGTPAPGYQWRKDGVDIAGATGATLTLTNVALTAAGSYTVVVTNVAGSVTSAAGTLTVPFARLINLSILTSLATAGDTFTMGYVVGGSGTSGAKPLVIRAAGPSLGALGLPGTVDDPKIELFAGPVKTGENDNWGGSATIANAMSAVGAFAYTGPTSRDAAAALSVGSGDNSVRVSAIGNGTGAVIAEIYDATPNTSFTGTTPRLVNVSVIKEVGAGFTLGFYVGGSGTRNVLVRAIGPTLGTAFGVSGAVSDPQLTLYSGQTAMAANDNWGGGSALSSAFSSVGAFVLPVTSRDAATVASLGPGSYTVQVSGVGGATGTILVEIYELP